LVIQYLEKRNGPYQGHFDFFLPFDLEAAFFAFAAMRINCLSAIKHADFAILQNYPKITAEKLAIRNYHYLTKL